MSRNPDAFSISFIAWKSVTRKIYRNIVLVLAVAMLVALLVFALLFRNAVNEDIKAAAMKLGADIVLVPTEALELADEFILESKRKTFYMDEFVFESIKDVEGIKQATFHVYLNTLESSCCSIIEGQVVAFDQQSDFVVKPWLDTQKTLKSGEVYVGSYLHEFLGLIDTANLFGSAIKVVGHLRETGTGLDHGIFMRLEDLVNITTEATGQRQASDISIIFLKLKDGADIDAVIAKIKGINPNIGVMTRGSIGKDVRATLTDITRIFTLTIMIASALAILLAWSTFSALANERKREVGILMAIGAHQKHILKIFMGEAAIISLIGGILGAILGQILLKLLAHDFHLLTKIGAVSSLSTQSLLISLVGLLAGGGVCLFGAIVPVLRLAAMEPLAAIKED